MTSNVLNRIAKKNNKLINEAKLPRIYQNILTVANYYWRLRFELLDRPEATKRIAEQFNMSKSTAWRYAKLLDTLVKMYINYHNTMVNILGSEIVNKLRGGDRAGQCVGNSTAR